MRYENTKSHQTFAFFHPLLDIKLQNVRKKTDERLQTQIQYVY